MSSALEKESLVWGHEPRALSRCHLSFIPGGAEGEGDSLLGVVGADEALRVQATREMMTPDEPDAEKRQLSKPPFG